MVFLHEAHIVVDTDSGLMHTVCGASGNVNDVTPANAQLHGQETDAFGDSGYQGANKRAEAAGHALWQALRRGSNPNRESYELNEQH